MRRTALLCIIVTLFVVTVLAGSEKSWAQQGPMPTIEGGEVEGNPAPLPGVEGNPIQEQPSQPATQPVARPVSEPAQPAPEPVPEPAIVQQAPTFPAAQPAAQPEPYANRDQIEKHVMNAAGRWSYYNPPAPSTREIVHERVRERVVVERVPYPHPSTKLGHHKGVGHQDIYREVKTWDPASASYVDARINREKTERISVDESLKKDLDTEVQSRIEGDKTLEKKIGRVATNPGMIYLLLGFSAILALLAIGIGLQFRDQN